MIEKVENGVRILNTRGEKIPYAISIDQKEYEQNIMAYKKDIITHINHCYICFSHTHKDTYVHFAPLDIINKIISDGYLIREEDEEGFKTLGSAIYTYPLKSGMFFYQEKPDYGFLVFEAEEKHYHIVQTDDSPSVLGEADFLTEKLEIKNPRIIRTYEEMEKLSRDNFNWKNSCTNYYGIKTDIDATYDNFFDIVAKYNGNE